MTFDKIEHKQIVLDLINQSSVQGQFIELLYELKKTVEHAIVISSNNEKHLERTE